MADSGEGISDNVCFALDVSHFHVVFGHFQEEPLETWRCTRYTFLPYAFQWFVVRFNDDLFAKDVVVEPPCYCIGILHH